MEIKTNKIRLYVVLLLWLNSVSISANETIAEVLSYGIYESGPTLTLERNRSAATGYTSTTLGYRHIKTAESIPVLKCLNFGLMYSISGLPDVEVDSIDIEIRHPKMKYHLGGETTYSNVSWEIYPENGYYEDYLIYILRNPYELLPGKWRFIIRYKEKQLISMDFTLEKSELIDDSIECN